MMGPDEPELWGVNRRAIRELLGLITSQDVLEVVIFVSMFECYNEALYDLLAPEGRVKRDLKTGPQGAFVANLTERPITSQKEVETAMDDGQKHRSLAATAMNSESSRSHLLFQIRVSTTNKVWETIDGHSRSARASHNDTAYARPEVIEGLTIVCWLVGVGDEIKC